MIGGGGALGILLRQRVDKFDKYLCHSGIILKKQKFEVKLCRDAILFKYEYLVTGTINYQVQVR